MTRRERDDDRLPWVPMAVAAVGAALLTGTFLGVQAAATSQEQPATLVDSAGTGTLRLVLRDDGAGFSQAVRGLVPGDVTHRYVDLVNEGTLDGRLLTLSLAAVPQGPLTDARRGLRVAVAVCAGGHWHRDDGTCSGQVRELIPSTPVGSLSDVQPLGVDVLAAGEVLHLRTRLELPDADERVHNGRLPDGAVQGRRVDLTWTFRQSQSTTAASAR